VLDEGAGERAGEDGVGEAGGEGAESGELVSKSEDVVVERMEAALVMLGEVLGFPGGDIDLDRALGFACLATEAEVEGLVDGFALKALGAECAGEHLPEEAGAAACGVLFVAGGAVAGTHDAAGGIAACADADAALRCAGEGTLVSGEGEVGFKIAHRGGNGRLRGCGRGLFRVDGGVVAEVFKGVVDADGVNELAGVHAVVRIPEDLEVAEGLHERGAEHLGQESGAGLAVAVLAREGAAEAEDDIRSAVNELAEAAEALDGAEVKVDAGVYAALAVVAIEWTAIAVFGHEGGDGAEVVAELVGGNGGVFPAFIAVRLAGDKDHSTEGGVADTPDGDGLLGSADADDGSDGPGLAGAGEAFGLGAGIFCGPCAHLDEQEADALRELGEVAEGEALAAHEVDEEVIKPLKADGMVLKGAGNGIGGEEGISKAEDGEDAEGRAGGEVESGGDDVGAGALRADEGSGDVEVAFGEQLVKIESGDAARDAGKSFADEVGVGIADLSEAGVELTDAATGLDFGGEFGGSCGADGESGSVIEDDVKGLDVIDDLAAEQAVDAATVVADHAAEGAAGVGCGIGRVGEVVEFGGVAETVKDDAGLDYGQPGIGINGCEAVHVFGVVEDYRYIGALASETGASAARQDGRSGGAAGGECGLNVGGVAGQNDADGKLTVVGGIGGVESAGTKIETDFATEGFLELGFKLAMGGEALVFKRRQSREYGKG